MRKLYFSTLFLVSILAFGQQYCYLDFGDPNKTTTGNWNNLSVTASQRGNTSLAISDMVDDTGTSTGISLAIYQDTSGTYYPFDNFNGVGTTAPSASIPFPATSTSDTFFGETGTFNGQTFATAGFTFSGLDASKYYTFNIFACRGGSVPDNRETQYTITGSSSDVVTLNPSNNTDNTVFSYNMMPSASGTIDLLVTKGPNNDNSLGFYYLGAVEMIITDEPLSTSEAKAVSKLMAYPIPASNVLNVTNPKNGEKQIEIYDVSGKRVMSKVFESSTETITLDVENLSKGVYFYKIGNAMSKFIKN